MLPTFQLFLHLSEHSACDSTTEVCKRISIILELGTIIQVNFYSTLIVEGIALFHFEFRIHYILTNQLRSIALAHELLPRRRARHLP